MVLRAFVLLLLQLPFAVFSQNVAETTYARSVIDTLTGDYFAGRGYQKNGSNKAADFLAGEFERIGLHAWDNDYYQEFSFPVVVPQTAEVRLNQEELVFGIDYLIPPEASSFRIAESELVELDFLTFTEENWRKNYETGAHLVVKVYPPKAENYTAQQFEEVLAYYASLAFLRNNNPRDLFVVSTPKLTYSIARHINGKKVIQLQEKRFQQDIQKFSASYTTYKKSRFVARNVIGVLPGKTDSTLYITAHYDHLGTVAGSVFRGANDNASGTAMLLDLAKYFAKNPTHYTLVFVAFAGEEAGLLGSQYFVKTVDLDQQKIRFVLNFDIMGTGDEGIQIVNSKVYEKAYSLLQEINHNQKYVPQIKRRGTACNSDHCPFHLAGVPSFFTYTLGGVSYYHDPLDASTTLPLTKFAAIRDLFIEFIDKGLPPVE